MTSVVRVVAFLYFALPISAVLAWGEPGHQIIGSIAEQRLQLDSPGVAQAVRSLLGFDLSLATTWADCARDVQNTSSGFKYIPGRMTPKVCQQFNGDEKNRMVDYASRNWSQCVYTSSEGCLGAYHFADVPTQRDSYDRSYAGTSDHDIVSAINAAIAVVQGQPCPAPFSIKDKREAVLLIAHFVGDIHQPLHVGAVYLDANGSELDPGNGPVDPANDTHGGNSIKDGSKVLHAEWDDVPGSLGTTASETLVRDAAAIPTTAGPVADWTAQWASETVRESHLAFQGLQFSGAGAGKWTVVEPANYASVRATEQTQQLVRAGARLAQLLKVILQ